MHNTSEKKDKEEMRQINIFEEVGKELAEWMAYILQFSFFGLVCREDGRESALLQSMFLMEHKDTDKNYQPLQSRDEMAEYCHKARDSFSGRKREIIQCLIEYLSDAFSEGGIAVRGEAVPMLVLFSDTAMRHSITPTDFRKFVDSLAENGEEML